MLKTGLWRAPTLPQLFPNLSELQGSTRIFFHRSPQMSIAEQKKKQNIEAVKGLGPCEPPHSIIDGRGRRFIKV